MFVLLNTAGIILNRDDIARFFTTVDVTITNQAVMPATSQDRLKVLTEVNATAQIMLDLKGGEDPIVYKRINLAVRPASTDLDVWHGLASLAAEDIADLRDRVGKIVNHLQRQENYNAMLATQQSGIRAVDGENVHPIQINPILPSPFSEKDIKNHGLRQKKVSALISSITEEHKDLPLVEARRYLDESALAAILNELNAVVAVVNK